MPVYKGSTEIASGKLTKGSTEIQNGYKGSDSFFINEATLTITFTDNTPTGASMNDTSQLTFTGTPGQAIPSVNRTVTRAANYIIGTPSVTKTGDSNNNVTVTPSLSGNVGFENGIVGITGTYPTTDVTVNLAVTCSATLKTAVTITGGGCSGPCNVVIGNTNTMSAWGWTAGAGNPTMSWSSSVYSTCPGSGYPTPTGKITMQNCYVGSDPGTTGSVANGTYNCTAYPPGLTAIPLGSNVTMGAGCGTYAFSLSIGESATHQSASQSGATMSWIV